MKYNLIDNIYLFIFSALQLSLPYLVIIKNQLYYFKDYGKDY